MHSFVSVAKAHAFIRRQLSTGSNDDSPHLHADLFFSHALVLVLVKIDFRR